MQSFLYGVFLQWKLDLRNREILIVYYIVPLVFFGFMGGVFSSINPEAYETLIPSMTIFGITMGAFLGAPTPLVQMYSSQMKKSYQVGGIPLWVASMNNFISCCIHLSIMSMVIYFIAPIAFDALIPTNFGVYFISLLIFIMTCTSIGTVLGLLVKSASKLTMLSQLFFLPSIMLSGIMFPVEMLPKAFEVVSKVFPATWGFLAMQQNQFTFTYIWPLILIMIVCFIITLILLKRVVKE